MDRRFSERRYTRYFPPHWQYFRLLATPEELAPTLDQFWQLNQKGSPHENETH